MLKSQRRAFRWPNNLRAGLYIQNPVNSRFWPNLGFKNLGSWTARNLKFCLQHDWCSTRRSSKFQVNWSFTRRDIIDRNLHFPEQKLRCIYRYTDRYTIFVSKCLRNDRPHIRKQIIWGVL